MSEAAPIDTPEKAEQVARDFREINAEFKRVAALLRDALRREMLEQVGLRDEDDP